MDFLISVCQKDRTMGAVTLRESKNSPRKLASPTLGEGGKPNRQIWALVTTALDGMEIA